ncbi:MAG: S-layer homology domain-containing protein [Faecalibacterium prausnitzii]|uniref:S-layer homology domain-containing protein n=1 Tax=Faecalibacterium prausnitzii TaxID=853 RepID=A0A9E1GLW4_9FIRM|nr:S-layer homology domain-containing protein [Faecalibacterium prausnitzii]
MKKRVLSMFMALALCLTLLPTAAFAEGADGGAPAADEQPAVQSEPAPQAAVQAAEVPAENAVAQVGNVNYANITDAFAAVKKNGGTLTLLADCETPNTNQQFDISGNYTLDLNGCTLTGRLYLSKTSTSLTVKDSGTGGKIQATSGWSPLWVDGGTVTIESGTLATEKENVQALVFGDKDACKTLTITGGSFETGYVYIGYDSGETVISGGDFHELRVNGDSKRVTLSGGTFDTVKRRKNGSTIAPADLLKDGYVFVNRETGAEVSTSQEDDLTNVMVVSQETVNALASLTVDGTATHYGTFEKALDAAQQTQGGTLTLLNNVTTTPTDINSGTFTLDLNGHTLTSRYNATLVVSGGSLTIQDSKGGVISSTSSDGKAVWCGGGNVTILGGSFPSTLYWESGTVSLQGGAFRSLDSKAGSWLSAIPERKALKKDDDHSVVDASANTIHTAAGFYVLADHEKHDWQAGKCACGRICDHAGKVDSTGYCTHCQMLVEAFETGGKRYTSLENALAAAQNGDTITLRGPLDIENLEPIEISKNIILNLNGHTLSKAREEALLCILGSNVVIANGTVQSTCVSKSANAVEVGKFHHTGAKLTLDNVTLEGSIGGGTGVRGYGLFICTGNEAVVMSGKVIGGIYTEGALTMSGGSAEQLKLGLLDNISVTLSGGSFGSIKTGNDASYQSLLAGGYAYQKQGGALLKLSEMKENTAVTVVKCSHPDDHSGGTVCPYCGCAAEVTKPDGSISYHRTTDAAIAAADGGTVKLLANADELTIGSPLTLDLNGKTAAKLTVTGDITLASLLPDGCAFKSGTTWITDLTGTELTHVSVARLPIQSMNYPTKMGMDYGGMGTLLVNVKGTGAVTFQWYKVENGKETAVGSATTKNQFNLAEQNLSAGKHIFRFSATCDGYKKMSQDIVITVGKADIGSNRITPPTAQENLTYTGQAQALITAGSVTDYGTMQYSLTENGTYSPVIPTGTDAGAYTVWYRVIGDENHNDTTPASVPVSIGKKPLTITGVTAASKPYDGTTDADIPSVTFDGVTLNPATDYTVTASFDDAGVGSDKNVTATVTLMEQAAKNYALEQSSFPTTASITKAAAPDFTKETALVIVNGHEKTYTVTLPALPTLETPKEYGAPTYELGDIKLNDGYYTGGAKVENGALTLPIQKNDVETTGPVGTVSVVIKSANYEDITLTVNVNATNKLVPTVTAPTANALTYNGAEQALVTAGKTTGGTMLYRLGDSEWSEQLPTAKNAGKYTVWYKVQGDAEYADVAEQSLTVTAAKKAVTVTALDKSAHTGSTAPDLSSPEADKNYKVEGLLGADTLSGTVTLTYAQTPDMSQPGKTAINIAGTLSNDNYEVSYAPGTLTVSDRPSSGGGGSSSGGSSSGGGTVKTETTKNNDGSVTKTETKKDGTKVETTTGKDGSVTKTTTNPNGSSVTETKAADGSTATVKTDKHGQTTAETTLSSKAVETAKRNGEPVTAPVEVEATRDPDTAPVVKVELPRSSADTKVEIPVTNVKPGTVAVLVHADGTEEIVKNSLPTENGIQLTINGGATVKIVDNSKDFADTRNHWAKDAIDFVSAHGLVNGMSATIYAPNASTTRAQLWTILARQNDADLTGGATWFENAQNWAKEKGISDGTNPNGTINRAQMVTMLWRAMGQPAAASGASFADVPADSYYAQAVAWAVENGITAGVGNGKFNPNGTCTRAQIATFLYRLYLSR